MNKAILETTINDEATMNKFITSTCLLVSSFCHGIDDNLDLLISQNEINSKISEVAEQINREYQDKPLSIIMVMKGAVCVTADLIRNLNIPFKLEYVKASSYGNNGMVAGQLTLSGLDLLDIEGRDVIIIDDIFETGNTMLGIIEKLQTKKPNSVKTLILLMKQVPRKTTYRPDFVLFDIQDYFVVGYGLDYKELYRGLPGIYYFQNNQPPF